MQVPAQYYFPPHQRAVSPPLKFKNVTLLAWAPAVPEIIKELLKWAMRQTNPHSSNPTESCLNYSNKLNTTVDTNLFHSMALRQILENVSTVAVPLLTELTYCF